MKAPCEAYPQLAWFLREEYIDCVITEDSDLIALSCRQNKAGSDSAVLKATAYALQVDVGIQAAAETRRPRIINYHSRPDFIQSRFRICKPSWVATKAAAVTTTKNFHG